MQPCLLVEVTLSVSAGPFDQPAAFLTWKVQKVQPATSHAFLLTSAELQDDSRCCILSNCDAYDTKIGKHLWRAILGLGRYGRLHMLFHDKLTLIAACSAAVYWPAVSSCRQALPGDAKVHRVREAVVLSPERHTPTTRGGNPCN
jgi:hypothetical protein